MPPLDQPAEEKTVAQVAADLGLYPVEAFEFVQQGLTFTVRRLHGEIKIQQDEPLEDVQNRIRDKSRHVSGQQLCEGLRDFALVQWGLLAETVLRRWNIKTTMDFGRIVFAMVEHQILQKTDEDSLDDFRNVFDFKSAFDAGYRIESKS